MNGDILIKRSWQDMKCCRCLNTRYEVLQKVDTYGVVRVIGHCTMCGTERYIAVIDTKQLR